MQSIRSASAAAAVLRDIDDDDIRIEDDTDTLHILELPRAFTDKRHLEKIEAFQTVSQPWRTKERVGSVRFIS